MTVHELNPQEAEHVESGLKLGTAGREAMELQLGDRIMTIGVELGRNTISFLLPKEPRWDGGEPFPPDLAASLPAIIGEISRFWKFEPVFRIY